MAGERAPVEGIGEEKLHVLGAHFLGGDAIGRALLALDATRHFQRLGIVKAAGAVRSVLSRMRATSAVFRPGRLPETEKITSSMPEARMDL